MKTLSSVKSLSHVRLFATQWTAACQAALSITNSQSPPKPMSIELGMLSSHLILCHPLLLLPSIFPSIRVFSNGLPRKSHGWRSLIGCSPWGREESDTTGKLHFPFSLSCIGEGNGNPLQCSCLENPRDGGAWWAVVYGVAESDTTEVT